MKKESFSQEEINLIKARYQVAKEQAGGKKGFWLDIGCNQGIGLSVLGNGFNIFGIDVRLDYLRQAKNVLDENKNLFLMDGRFLGFADNSLNVISCFEVIEHLESGDQERLLVEVNRVLKPDGLFFLSTPNPKARGRRLISQDHQRELEEEELKALLEKHNFKILEFLGQGNTQKQNLYQEIWRRARDNSFFHFIYHNLLPWTIRSRWRDQTIRELGGIEVRKPKENEAARTFFVICQKETKTPAYKIS